MKGEIFMRAMKKLLSIMCLAMVLTLGMPIIMPFTDVITSVEAATKVKLNKTKATIFVGKSVQLKIKGTKSKVKWASNNKSVAKVSSNGKVTGKKAGKAVITAKVGKKRYKCSITVKKKKNSKSETVDVKSISLNQTEMQLNEEESATLVATVIPYNATNKVVSWSSSDTSVATVNNGVVTGIKMGVAIITAEIGDIKQLCVVTVKRPIIKVTDLVMDKECIVRIGSKKTIDVSYLPLNANEEFVPSFTSLDTSIVTVSKTGELTPIKAGETNVEVKFGELYKTIHITVLESKAKLIEAENARYETELDELYDTYSGYLNVINMEIEAVIELYGYYYGTEQEYQEEVSDLCKQISNIKKQMAAYSGNSSQEAKVKLQRLQASLNSYENQLEEIENKWSGRTRIDLLNEQADLYVEEYNEAVRLAKNKHLEKINEINADIE